MRNCLEELDCNRGFVRCQPGNRAGPACPAAHGSRDQAHPHASSRANRHRPRACACACAPIVVPRDWRGVFTAIRAGQWAAASAGIAALPPGPLSAVARAELYTAKNSPQVDLAPILALLAEAPDLPQAGAIAAPGGGSRRDRDAADCRSMADGAAGKRAAPPPVAGRSRRARPPTRCAWRSSLASRRAPLPKPRRFINKACPCSRSRRGRKAAHRVAWIYYVLGRDADARRVAETGLPGAVGEWAAQAALDCRAGVVAAQRLRFGRHPFPRRHQRPCRIGTGRRRRLLGGAVGDGLRPPARGRALAQGRGALAGKLLRAGRARDSWHGQTHSAACDTLNVPRSNRFPTSAERCCSPRSGNMRRLTNFFAIRRESAIPRIIWR